MHLCCCRRMTFIHRCIEFCKFLWDNCLFIEPCMFCFPTCVKWFQNIENSSDDIKFVLYGNRLSNFDLRYVFELCLCDISWSWNIEWQIDRYLCHFYQLLGPFYKFSGTLSDVISFPHMPVLTFSMEKCSLLELSLALTVSVNVGLVSFTDFTISWTTPVQMYFVVSDTTQNSFFVSLQSVLLKFSTNVLAY